MWRVPLHFLLPGFGEPLVFSGEGDGTQLLHVGPLRSQAGVVVPQHLVPHHTLALRQLPLVVLQGLKVDGAIR